MTHSTEDCLCEKAFTETIKAFKKEQPESVIYQTSLMSALLSGVYEGSVSVSDLLKKGDFGLGTFNQLDGEMIAFDSNVWQLRADGSARSAQGHQKTPFAVMTFFRPQYSLQLTQPTTREELHRIINTKLVTDNHFCALRINGDFQHITTRTVPCQQRPYRPMTEVINEQPLFHFEHRNGVIVGFRTPEYMQGVNVAGYHEHFITDDRKGGGHILDYTLTSGELTFGEIHKLIVDLPREGDFLQANLNPHDLDSAIRTVES